ncbi:MAG: hypothetical protein JEZ03_10820 [Bacteroidales bacterium]|nr:hypothetical protein [Bacteroidales bacterium]
MEMLEILKYVLPATVVFGTVYIMLRLYFSNEHKRRMLELTNDKNSAINPVRLQAYERMILFLERISPSALILRSTYSGAGVQEIQYAMIESIRQEFDHNLSQQLYLSSICWEMIRKAKDEYIATINRAAAENKDNTDLTQFASAIVLFDISNEDSGLRKSIELLKSEARTLMN